MPPEIFGEKRKKYAEPGQFCVFSIVLCVSAVSSYFCFAMILSLIFA
jgi:hypothetical protein